MKPVPILGCHLARCQMTKSSCESGFAFRRSSSARSAHVFADRVVTPITSRELEKIPSPFERELQRFASPAAVATFESVRWPERREFRLKIRRTARRFPGTLSNATRDLACRDGSRARTLARGDQESHPTLPSVSIDATARVAERGIHGNVPPLPGQRL